MLLDYDGGCTFHKDIQTENVIKTGNINTGYVIEQQFSRYIEDFPFSYSNQKHDVYIEIGIGQVKEMCLTDSFPCYFESK